MNHKLPDFERKIMAPTELFRRLGELRRPLVFTNGCFDILHRGHVTYLAQARELGSSLVVGLNTDESVRRLGKGDDRPVNSLANRMSVIASLAAVDYVTYFDDDTPLELILMLKPDVLVKGGDWSISNIIGSQEILANGGQVYSIPFLYETSTTKLINRIRKT